MADWEFFDEIPMDRTHTLDQLTGRFQTVEAGLPELVKNSKDQYMRLGVDDRADRQILVAASTTRRMLTVIDFAGAEPSRLRRVGDMVERTDEQGAPSAGVEAGHGNGGKAFMVRGSSSVSFMESCARGRRTKMGFDNASQQRLYIPAYAIEDGAPVKDAREGPGRLVALPMSSVPSRLRLGTCLPHARPVFRNRGAFTSVVIEGVREWEGKRQQTVRKLASEMAPRLSMHAQASLAVETCDVWLISDGRLLTPQPLKPE